ncbi:ATP-grasp domain-containing protein [Kitasatospora sp. NPDC093558]|uniref:ATP-grasp domain-containing protein n=1 Tax=Kitasatospora sp. NPDC093558 TaxID=3155201 RepID=UPI0034387B2F
MSTEPFILVVGSGPKEYREELFRSLSGSRVWLLSDQEPTWQRDYISGYTVIPRLKAAQVSTNITFLLDTVRKLAASAAIRGVLTFEEMFLSATCQIADELGLPSLGRGVAENCRDKERTRQLLTDAGVRQPRFAFAKTAEEAAEISEEFGYPVVLKPRGLAGSIGVIMVRSSADLEAGFHVAASAARDGAQRHGGGALVEQFLAGPEIAVDAVVVDGQLEPMYIIRKRFGPEPFFEETGQTINADDSLLFDAGLIEMLRNAHTALGIRTGMTHTEIRLTPNGPVIIEVNGRLAGDFVPHLAKLATGLNGATIAARVACGEPALIERNVQRSAAHQIVYADRDGTFNAISLPSPESHPNLVATGTLLAAGTQVALPPRGYMARLGYAIVAAPSASECEASLMAAVADMSADITPSQ